MVIIPSSLYFLITIYYQFGWFWQGCVNLSCSLISLMGSPFPMVLVLGPEFRIPTQNFKIVKVTSVELFGVVCESGSYLGSPGTCHVSQLLGSLLYLDSQPGQLRRLAPDLDSLYNLARIWSCLRPVSWVPYTHGKLLSSQPSSPQFSTSVDCSSFHG